MIHVMQLPTHGNKDKCGLSFKGPRTVIVIAQIHEIQDEEYYEEPTSQHEDLLFEAPSSLMYQCSLPPFLFEQINMVGISLISPFSHPLEFDDIHVVDQDTVDFYMLSITDLATHGNFIYPCDHVDPYEEQLYEDTYWPLLVKRLLISIWGMTLIVQKWFNFIKGLRKRK